MGKKISSGLVWSSAAVFIFFIIDRGLKNIFLNSDIEFFSSEGFLAFYFQGNEGISYGIQISNWLIIFASIFIILALGFFIFRAAKKEKTVYYIPLLLIIAGALSNLIDRLRYGFVIDMIVIAGRLVINIADVLIFIGAVWLVIIYLRSKNRQKNEIEDLS